MNFTPKKPKRGEVWHCTDFDDKTNTEHTTVEGSRYVVVVSPDSINTHSDTVMVVPMTKGSHAYAFRIPVVFKDKNGFALCDQLFATGRASLASHQGALSSQSMATILVTLQNMFKIT